MWCGIILLKNKARVLQEELQQNRSKNVFDVSLGCKCASDDQRSLAVKGNGTPDPNSYLMTCLACNSKSRIGTLLWAPPDTSSMVVKSQLETGFITKHYIPPVSMIPT
ncbi:hypothetical protein TNCV_1420871 [Trichonephila clavipes]|nr:hypothetical protein TNCV_1420871 [Trichonephila clavipes]